MTVARWRANLAPWSAQVAIASPSSHQTFTLPPGLTRDSWLEFVARCREAFELLETLAIVERVSWTDMLRTLRSTDHTWGCSPVPHPCKDSLFEAAGRFLVGAQPIRDGTINIVEVATIYFAFDESIMSPAFRNAMQEIDATLTPESKLRLAHQETIPLTFSFTMRHAPVGAPAASYLRSIRDLTQRLVERASRAESSGPWQYRMPFKLQHVKLIDINECAPEERGLAGVLAELLALGVQLYENIDIGNQSWFMSCPIPELGPVLLDIVDPASLRASLGIEQLVPEVPMKRLFLTDFRFDLAVLDERAYLRQLGAVFSALSSARTLTKLRLYANNGTGSRQSAGMFVRWLTLTLFSKDAVSSSISSLDIDASQLAPADTVGIAQVLGAKNPSRALLFAPADARASTTRQSTLESNVGERDLAVSTLEAHDRSDTNAPAVVGITDDNDDDDRDLGFAVVKTGTRIWVQSLDGSNDHATDSFVLQQDGRFRVIQDDDSGGWVAIVVPCYGHCVVPRPSIVHFDMPETSGSSLHTGYNGSLTTLTLSSDSSDSGLLSLVYFVGAKLQSLTIRGKLGTNNLRRLLSTCRNLTSLSVRHTAEGADEVFIEAYERRQCKIESLSIDGFWGLDGRSSTAFIRVLQDSASAAAKTLRSLRLFETHPQAIDEAVLDAYASMLTSNQTLQYLSLCALDEIFCPRETALMETDGRWLMSRPLPSPQRFTFLSVLRRFSSAPGAAELPRKRTHMEFNHDSVDLGQLDPAVIRLVFAFAGDGAIRDLQLDYYDSEYPPPERF